MSYRPMILFGLIACIASTAGAEAPYYFHKADVSREAYMADVERCRGLATGVSAPNGAVRPDYNAPYGVESAAIANFFIGFLQRAEQRRLVSRIERTCMADKGYQRREIDRAVYEQIRKLDDSARLDRLFGLVTAQQPTGKVLVE